MYDDEEAVAAVLRVWNLWEPSGTLRDGYVMKRGVGRALTRAGYVNENGETLTDAGNALLARHPES